MDLILIFFDPVGQALCKRTMEVVEALNAGPHLEKVHYFLSKVRRRFMGAEGGAMRCSVVRMGELFVSMVGLHRRTCVRLYYPVFP